MTNFMTVRVDAKSSWGFQNTAMDGFRNGAFTYPVLLWTHYLDTFIPASHISFFYVTVSSILCSALYDPSHFIERPVLENDRNMESGSGTRHIFDVLLSVVTTSRLGDQLVFMICKFEVRYTMQNFVYLRCFIISMHIFLIRFWERSKPRLVHTDTWISAHLMNLQHFNTQWRQHLTTENNFWEEIKSLFNL